MRNAGRQASHCTLSFCAMGLLTTVELPVMVASLRPATGAAAVAPEADVEAGPAEADGMAGGC